MSQQLTLHTRYCCLSVKWPYLGLHGYVESLERLGLTLCQTIILVVPIDHPSQASHPCVVSAHSDSGLSHVTCFGPWDVSKSDADRNWVALTQRGLYS